MHKIPGLSFVLVSTISVTAAAYFYPEWKSGIEWREPAVVKPGDSGSPPADAIVLFDGQSLDAWQGVENWTIEGGVATVGSTIITK